MSVNSNVPGRSTGFEQMLVEWNEIYLQNEKFKISDHYTITWWKAKLSKKKTRLK